MASGSPAAARGSCNLSGDLSFRCLHFPFVAVSSCYSVRFYFQSLQKIFRSLKLLGVADNLQKGEPPISDNYLNTCGVYIPGVTGGKVIIMKEKDLENYSLQ